MCWDNRVAFLKASGASSSTFSSSDHAFGSRMTGDEIAEDTKYDTPDDILKLGKTAVTNFINYGSTGWYDWAIENWGTKWNSYDPWKGQEGERLWKWIITSSYRMFILKKSL